MYSSSAPAAPTKGRCDLCNKRGVAENCPTEPAAGFLAERGGVAVRIRCTFFYGRVGVHGAWASGARDAGSLIHYVYGLVPVADVPGLSLKTRVDASSARYLFSRI